MNSRNLDLSLNMGWKKMIFLNRLALLIGLAAEGQNLFDQVLGAFTGSNIQ